jgi:hypothetical protein
MRHLQPSRFQSIKTKFLSVEEPKLKNTRLLQNQASSRRTTTCVYETFPSYKVSQNLGLSVNYQANDDCSDPE